MEVLSSGSGQSGRVWIENHPTEGWVPGTVDSIGGNGKYIVVDDDGEQFEVPQDKARPVDPACLKGVEDLLSLGDFNEGALLHNVRVRYFKDDIYTGIGAPILISVNPFMSLPSLYNSQKQKFYRDQSAAMASGQNAEVPPHLFSVGASSYTTMLNSGSNQSIIISGESGAGKTEATKRILTYFASLQSATKSGEADAGKMGIEEQVLRSNPILEAYGNAKTLRNDNSSRFGKYIDIEFDTTGKLKSARISNYLLEKSRIVKQQPDERGYHAFYCLCAGAANLDIGSSLYLGEAYDHAYIQGTTEIPGVDDSENFQEMTDCMGSLGFSTEERNSVLKITAAVLHLGDMEFAEHADSADGSKICDPDRAAQICELLHVDMKDFTKLFQYKTLQDPVSKKIIDMPQDPAGASNTRHSVARATYSRLFDWLVWRINQSTSGEKGKKETKRIGILDIYGFEVFEWNSFEQLCINFANEKLQQHFNSHMFTLEQQVYSEEGIAWSHIEFVDNAKIIDALEKKPVGLFCLIDGECLMPRATDMTCLAKIYKTFEGSKICYKPSRFASTNFGVAHYAGEVIYDITTFLEKNTDKLHSDITNLLKTSKMPVLNSLFSDPKFAPELAGVGTSVRAGGGAAPKRPAAGGRAGGAAAGGGGKQNVTVSMMFRQQLDQLVDDLNKTTPRYIRCIKPNANKAAHEFDSMDVQRQLRCAGMLEAIRIRRAGYSVRRPFKEFYNRFRVLCPSIAPVKKADPDYKDLSRKILTEMEIKFRKDTKKPLEDKSWQVGRSKVFMKEDLQGRLEESIGVALQRYVLCVQKRWRGYMKRKWFKAVKKAAGLLQTGLRTARAVAEYKAELERNKACVMIQAGFTTLRQQTRRVACRRGAREIQRHFRGWSCRRREKRKKEVGYELDVMKKEAEQKEKALADMQKQLELERQKAQEEAKKKLEERQKAIEEAHRARQSTAAAAPQGPTSTKDDTAVKQEQEQAQKEILDLKKENARLQGMLETQPSSPTGGGAASVEVQQLRKDLTEMKREKVKLEVEMAGMKKQDEFELLATEVYQVREEISFLRRAQLDAQVQLEQRKAQLSAAQTRGSRGQQAASELSTLKATHDELQVKFERVVAQKTAFEERLKEAEATRAELRELRLDQMRLEGELESSTISMQAVKEKLKNAEKNNQELQQSRQKKMTMDSELDASKRNIERLNEQVRQMMREGSKSRTESLDGLRSELLARIETRPSIVPGTRPNLAAVTEEPGLGQIEERKTIMDQRSVFERLRNQFLDAQQSGADPVEDEPVVGSGGAREAELEEELRQAIRENSEAQMRISSLQDELQDKSEEAANLLRESSMVQAELADLKFQLEQEVAGGRRQTADIIELQERIQTNEDETRSFRKRLSATEDRKQQAEEERRALRPQAARLEDQREAAERAAQDLQRKASDALRREREAASQLEQQRSLLEQSRRAVEAVERMKVDTESTAQWLQSENERLKAELADANQERSKIRQVVDELMVSGVEGGAEQQKEADKFRQRANHFEREYQQSKQLNSEMTKVMSQMTQAVSVRGDQNSDAAKQNKQLVNQLEAKSQEVKQTKQGRDDAQKQLDSLKAQGSYFQDKYRETCEEMRTLRQEHSVSTATSTRLKTRVETLQRELEDLKTQLSKVGGGASPADDSRLDNYESHLRDLQRKLRAQDEELGRSQAFAAKSQQVNDCLNTLLVLESEQTNLYEMTCDVKDERLLTQFESKKRKGQDVIGRLNDIMSDEERPSVAFLQGGMR